MDTSKKQAFLDFVKNPNNQAMIAGAVLLATTMLTGESLVDPTVAANMKNEMLWGMGTYMSTVLGLVGLVVVLLTFKYIRGFLSGVFKGR